MMFFSPNIGEYLTKHLSYFWRKFKPMIKKLPIKKIYFDQIKSGEKKYEYREVKKWFEWLDKDEIKFLSLHYYSQEKLIVEIKSKKKIPIPDHLKSFFPNATYLWEIKIEPN